MRTRRLAFAAIINTAGTFGIGIAEENEPGYYPQPQYGSFPTYEVASKQADELNKARLHLTKEDAAKIVASSMYQKGKRKR